LFFTLCGCVLPYVLFAARLLDLLANILYPFSPAMRLRDKLVLLFETDLALSVFVMPALRKEPEIFSLLFTLFVTTKSLSKSKPLSLLALFTEA
jgi:hypothetical protein